MHEGSNPASDIKILIMNYVFTLKRQESPPLLREIEKDIPSAAVSITLIHPAANPGRL